MNEDSDFIDRDIKLEDIEWNAFQDCTLIYESRVSRLYRARKAGRYYILKTLKSKNGTLSAEELYLLKREFLLSNGIVHPNIADIYSFESDSPVGPCIVMEYVDGCNLKEFLNTAPNLKTRKKIFGQVLDAIELIHSHGITHNDIKPENILVTTKGEDVRLIDFGFSTDDAQYLAEKTGFTASYAAPEIVGAGGKADARSDIFSIGLLMNDIFGNRYSGIARKCTRKDKNKRYENVASLKRAWHRAQSTALFLVISAVALITAGAITCLSIDNSQVKEQLDEITIHKNMVDSTLSVAYAHMDMEYERTVRGIKGTNCKDLAFQIKCLFTLRICSYKKEFCKDNFSSEEDKVFAAEMIDHYETELSDRLIKLFDNYPSLNELKKILPESEYKQLSDAATRTLPEQIQKVVDEMARPSF